jgi:hypothetical protein
LLAKDCAKYQRLHATSLLSKKQNEKKLKNI